MFFLYSVLHRIRKTCYSGLTLIGIAAIMLSGFSTESVKGAESQKVHFGLYPECEDITIGHISQVEKNALKRIAQLAKIQWQPVLENAMPSQKRRGVFSGDVVTGVPYSSAGYPTHRIGYGVSLETFMTAVQNPKSVLYTEDLRKPPYNHTNSATYYGLACSAFAQYAFRNDFSRGTAEVYTNPENANMAVVEEQSAEGVQLLDIINTRGRGHQEIVTGVTFSGEEIVSIQLTDITGSGVRIRNYTPEEFNKYLQNRNYLIYRYNMPEEISYTPSKYVAVGSEEPQEITYNEIIALDRGNKSNYKKGSAVKFNIMDEEAVALVVKKGGVIVYTYEIAETGIIEKTFSDTGRYSAHCVMKDMSKSDKVEFIVAYIKVNAPETAESVNDITVTFSAEEATPRFIWGYNVRALTEQEIKDGAFTMSIRPGVARSPRTVSIVVNGVNEFGGIWSTRERIRITPTQN